MKKFPANIVKKYFKYSNSEIQNEINLDNLKFEYEMLSTFSHKNLLKVYNLNLDKS